MSASIQARGAKFQLRVIHKLLPKAFFYTFDSQVEAENYRDRLLSLLQRGIVPESLLMQVSAPKRSEAKMLSAVVLDYQRSAPITESDDILLAIMQPEIVGVRVSDVTFDWADNYVVTLKSPKHHLAPGTIRKRIGALARVLDWHIRQSTPDGEQPRVNPLRMLPRGYSLYGKADTAVEVKHDVERNRRLSADEAARIDKVLAGYKREDRERALITEGDELPLLYALIVDTGLRLFEAYRLKVESIDFGRNIINVEGSKGHRGRAKPRVVPLKVHLREPLRAKCEGRSGLVFGFWDGTPEGRKNVQLRLSSRFKNLFAYADVPDCTEHDLRHEAACRWFTLRAGNGWVFSELEICKIMGWSDTRMALRYLSLRGEDLSSRLG